jgi:hypothetical protein
MSVPNTILRAPRKDDYKPDRDTRRRISQYLALIYGCHTRDIQEILPAFVTRWGKVRIANGGDKIRAGCAVSRTQAQSFRDSSFVCVSEPTVIMKMVYSLNPQYTLIVSDTRRGQPIPTQRRQVFYGRLECIIDTVLPHTETFNIQSSTRYLLAVIQPCSTRGRDATRELTTYAETTTPVVIDLRTIECVVGRVRRGNEWGIVDRSGDFARTVFVDLDDDDA